MKVSLVEIHMQSLSPWMSVRLIQSHSRSR